VHAAEAVSSPLSIMCGLYPCTKKSLDRLARMPRANARHVRQCQEMGGELGRLDEVSEIRGARVFSLMPWTTTLSTPNMSIPGRENQERATS